MKVILYVVVILLANTIGAISGMGGGVIIKPALQIFNWDSVLTINFYSSVAVFTMAVSSTWKQIKAKNAINKTCVVGLSLGSILGGIAGDISFGWFYSRVGDDISSCCADATGHRLVNRFIDSVQWSSSVTTFDRNANDDWGRIRIRLAGNSTRNRRRADQYCLFSVLVWIWHTAGDNLFNCDHFL